MAWWPWLLALEFSVGAVWGESHSCRVMGIQPDWVLISILVCGSFLVAGGVCYDLRRGAK